MVTEEQLREIPLLSNIDSAELNVLATLLDERDFRDGNYIVREADPSPNLYFIAAGKVKVTLLSPEGKEIVVAHLGPGDFFGEIGLLLGEDRSANVVAQTDCKLLILTDESFTQHLLKATGLALAMLKEMAHRLRSATDKIGDLALYDVYRRVARTLKHMGEVTIEDGHEIFVIDNRPTHQELANNVGTSREMVTRALKGLEEDGCIATEGKTIILKKLPR